MLLEDLKILDDSLPINVYSFGRTEIVFHDIMHNQKLYNSMKYINIKNVVVTNSDIGVVLDVPRWYSMRSKVTSCDKKLKDAALARQVAYHAGLKDSAIYDKIQQSIDEWAAERNTALREMESTIADSTNGYIKGEGFTDDET